MKIKTSELIGAKLDWAVAKVEEVEVSWRYKRELVRVHDCHFRLIESIRPIYSPSSNWSQGGPLIEKFGVMLIDPGTQEDGEWGASTSGDTGFFFGATPLIAICRAIVAAKLGEEIEVPEELVCS